MSSLTAMIQKGIQNEVPEKVLEQCPESERTLIENILLLAQAELETLNLSGTTIAMDGHKISVKCGLAGGESRIALSSMRTIQNYSPARIVDVKAQLSQGILYLCIDVADGKTRISCTELEVVRVCKRKRFIF